MAGVHIKVSVDDANMQDLLKRIGQNLGNMKPAMKIIGSTIRASVIRNFEKGGRPKKWKKHSKTTEKRRGKGAAILMVQGLRSGLAGSIHYKAEKDSVSIATDDRAYAAVHQFGAKKGSFGSVVATVRSHLRNGIPVREHTRKMILPWGDIPARPFMMIQDEDWTEIRHALNDFITGKA